MFGIEGDSGGGVVMVVVESFHSSFHSAIITLKMIVSTNSLHCFRDVRRLGFEIERVLAVVLFGAK